jgi:hypothetical protein
MWNMGVVYREQGVDIWEWYTVNGVWIYGRGIPKKWTA